MKNKILLTLAALLFGFAGLYAQTVEIQKQTVPAGSVTVNVSLTGFQPLGAITLYISYDQDLLTYQGGSFVYGNGTMLVNPSAQPDQMRLNWISNDVINGYNPEGNPIPLVFNFKGGFQADLDITFTEIADPEGAVVPLNTITIIDGWIKPDVAEGEMFLGSTYANVGAPAAIAITAAPETGQLEAVTALDFLIDYDPAKLQFLNVSNNSLGMTVSTTSGSVALKWANTAGTNLNTQQLPSLNFTYLGGGVANVNFAPGSQVISDQGTIENVSFMGGTVQVNPAGPFDATLSIAEVLNPPDATNVPVAISISDDLAGVGIIDLTMQFDPSMVSYLGYTANQQSQWLVLQSNGVVRFRIISSVGMNINEGTVLTPRFEYNTSEKADIVFGPSVVTDTDGDAIAVLFADGFIRTANALAVSSGPNGQLAANYDGSYDIGTEIEIEAIADAGYVFDAWTGDVAFLDDASLATATVTMPDEDVDLTANFVVDATVFFDLTTAAGPFGSATGGGSFNVERQQLITATPDPGYKFIEWTGDVQYITTGDVTDLSVTVTMPAQDITLTATFEGYTISGIVKYANPSGPVRPINTNATSTTEVILFASDGTTEITRVDANINGAYLFENVPAGDYVVTAVTNKVWGGSGVTLADYAVIRSFVANGTPIITGMRFLAGDINMSGTLTLADYAVIRNYVNTSVKSPAWTVPDWIFGVLNLTVTNSNLIDSDVVGICSGDANASYVPPL